MSWRPSPDLPAGGRCFEQLVVIDDPEPHSGPVNMALDELLLDEVRQGPPRLRFYRWSEPAVSFGWFESAADARCLAGDRPLVRRPTGGGLVEHGYDLTYTLIVPRSEPFVRLRPSESYRLIHAAVAAALTQVGRQSASHLDPGNTAPDAGGNACFQRPVLHDLTSDGHKIAGGAQRRTRAGLLHQGSVLLPDAGGADWRQSLRRLLPTLLASHCEERGLTDDEIARAKILADARYATAEWTNRR